MWVSWRYNSRVTNHPGRSGTVLVLAQKCLIPKKPHSPGQTGIVGHSKLKASNNNSWEKFPVGWRRGAERRGEVHPRQQAQGMQCYGVFGELKGPHTAPIWSLEWEQTGKWGEERWLAKYKADGIWNGQIKIYDSGLMLRNLSSMLRSSHQNPDPL